MTIGRTPDIGQNSGPIGKGASGRKSDGENIRLATRPKRPRIAGHLWKPPTLATQHGRGHSRVAIRPFSFVRMELLTLHIKTIP